MSGSFWAFPPARHPLAGAGESRGKRGSALLPPRGCCSLASLWAGPWPLVLGGGVGLGVQDPSVREWGRGAGSGLDRCTWAQAAVGDAGSAKHGTSHTGDLGCLCVSS